MPSPSALEFGTPLSPSAVRVLLLGSGELGKEVAIELQRFGCEVIAADRYADAPAMQVAHRSHVLNMLDGDALRALIADERPTLIVPEIEAIHTETLVQLEREFAERGTHTRIVPTARAARLTMDREGIRRLAAETLGLPTSPYRFVDTLDDYRAAVAAIGVPCVVKPVMSSSGKGQSLVRTAEVVADVGIPMNQLGGQWRTAVHAIQQAVRADAFPKFLEALDQLGSLLQSSVPRREDDINELPDEVVAP